MKCDFCEETNLVDGDQCNFTAFTVEDHTLLCGEVILRVCNECLTDIFMEKEAIHLCDCCGRFATSVKEEKSGDDLINICRDCESKK